MSRRDPVTAEVREYVLRRDGRCVLAMFDASHSCYDVYGTAHASDDLDHMTLEHIKWKPMMGRRAPSEPSSLVTLCGWRNVIRPMSKVERSWTRTYLLKVEPHGEEAP